MGCSVLQLDEKIQEQIRRKLGLVDDLWARKGLEEKAMNIFGILSKEFVLCWMMCGSELILTQNGSPSPKPKTYVQGTFHNSFC